MDAVRLIRVKQDIRADNQAAAEALRKRLAKQKTFLLNLMSAPGAGKTTPARPRSAGRSRAGSVSGAWAGRGFT